MHPTPVSVVDTAVVIVSMLSLVAVLVFVTCKEYDTKLVAWIRHQSFPSFEEAMKKMGSDLRRLMQI